MQLLSGSAGHTEWGLVLAVVFILIGAGNLLTLYTLARYFRRRERDRRRHGDKTDRQDPGQREGRR